MVNRKDTDPWVLDETIKRLHSSMIWCASKMHYDPGRLHVTGYECVLSHATKPIATFTFIHTNTTTRFTAPGAQSR
jgi:hypothetical protein